MGRESETETRVIKRQNPSTQLSGWGRQHVGSLSDHRGSTSVCDHDNYLSLLLSPDLQRGTRLYTCTKQCLPCGVPQGDSVQSCLFRWETGLVYSSCISLLDGSMTVPGCWLVGDCRTHRLGSGPGWIC